MSTTTQFSVRSGVKNRLDRFKAEHKEAIIAKYKKRTRFVTNADAIEFLLDKAGVKR